MEMHLLNFEGGTDISDRAPGSLSFLRALEVCIGPVSRGRSRWQPSFWLAVPRWSTASAGKWLTGHVFGPSSAPKVPLFRRSAAARAVASRMMQKGTEISLLSGARLPCRQKLSRNQQFPSLSLSKSGYHSAGALEHEFTGAAHVRYFGLVVPVAKEKPFISP